MGRRILAVGRIKLFDGSVPSVTKERLTLLPYIYGVCLFRSLLTHHNYPPVRNYVLAVRSLCLLWSGMHFRHLSVLSINIYVFMPASPPAFLLACISSSSLKVRLSP